MDAKLAEALRATPGAAAVIADRHGLPLAAHHPAGQAAVAPRAAAAAPAAVVGAAAELWRAGFGAGAPADLVVRVEAEDAAVTAQRRGHMHTAVFEKAPR
jgi:hypothetical protein